MFSYFNPDPANIRNQADIGGGALYDIGCYAIVAARDLFGTEPLRAISLIDRDPGMKIDRISSGLVDFSDGRQLVFTCGMQLSATRRCIRSAPRGGLRSEIPFNAPPGKPCRLFVETANSGNGPQLIETEPCDHTLCRVMKPPACSSARSRRLFLSKTG